MPTDACRRTRRFSPSAWQRRLSFLLGREKERAMSMSRASIDDVWRRLKALEGQAFETKTGKPFTFELDGDVFRPTRTKYNVAKADFRKALELVPLGCKRT